jgi:protein disulfide-isomerase-like protein
MERYVLVSFNPDRHVLVCTVNQSMLSLTRMESIHIKFMLTERFRIFFCMRSYFGIVLYYMFFSKAALCVLALTSAPVYSKSSAGKCAGTEFYEGTAVMDLCSAHFPDKSSPNVWMIEFYAPWCPHCKNLTPIYVDAAKQLKKAKEKDIKFGAVDCTKEQDLCQRYGIKGYPTIKTFVNGKSKTYEGARESEPMIAHMKHLRDTRSTKGGSAKCSTPLVSGDKKDGAVALCSSHFPNSKGKNSWAVLFHGAVDSATDSLKKQVSEIASSLSDLGVKLGVVDCSVGEEFCKEQVGDSVSGGELIIKTYKKGGKKISKESFTKGLSDASGVVQFAKSQLGISQYDEL